MDQKRVGRLFAATRIVYDLSVGKVLSRQGVGFRVDLVPFYEVVKGRSESDIDGDLLEFYAKAIVGLLTRLNREYIQQSPSNRKVFTTALRKLHDLIFLAREVDKFRDRASRATSDLEGLLALAGGGASPAVTVYGAALPDLEIGFALPEIARQPGSPPEIRTIHSKLTLTHGDGPDIRRASLLDARGRVRKHALSARDLSHISFWSEEGEVVWRRSGMPEDGR